MAEDWNAYFRRIRLGRWTDNGAICWMPFHGFHHFIAGETDYGKSNTERVILSELSYGIDQGAIEVIGIDAQLGVELQPVARRRLPERVLLRRRRRHHHPRMEKRQTHRSHLRRRP